MALGRPVLLLGVCCICASGLSAKELAWAAEDEAKEVVAEVSEGNHTPHRALRRQTPEQPNVQQFLGWLQRQQQLQMEHLKQERQQKQQEQQSREAEEAGELGSLFRQMLSKAAAPAEEPHEAEPQKQVQGPQQQQPQQPQQPQQQHQQQQPQQQVQQPHQQQQPQPQPQLQQQAAPAAESAMKSIMEWIHQKQAEAAKHAASAAASAAAAAAAAKEAQQLKDAQQAKHVEAQHTAAAQQATPQQQPPAQATPQQQPAGHNSTAVQFAEQEAPTPQAAQNVADWMRQHEGMQRAHGLQVRQLWHGNPAESAAQVAAVRSAQSALGGLAAWAQGEASKANSTQVPSHDIAREAMLKVSDAWKQLMSKAHSAATQAAEEAAPKILQKSLQVDKQQKTRAAVESSIAEAEGHMRDFEAAATKADKLARETAQKAAQESTEKAMQELLSWADQSPTYDYSRNFPRQLSEAAASTQKEAVKAFQGFNFPSVAAPKAQPALATALQNAKEAAGGVLQRSKVDGRELLIKSIEAARRAISPEDQRRAWVAVTRAYGSARKMEEDAHRAMASSTEALNAVVAALSDVGRRAVGQVLRSEVAIFAGVADKMTREPGNKETALLQGALAAQHAAQEAWQRGIAEGLKAVPAQGITAKVQRASQFTAVVANSWARAVAQVLSSEEARHTIAKAAEAATRAAAAATMEASHVGVRQLGETVNDVARKLVQAKTPQPPAADATDREERHIRREWPVEPGLKVVHRWKPDGSFRGRVMANLANVSFHGTLGARGNDTHQLAVYRAKVGSEQRYWQGRGKFAASKFPYVASEMKGEVTFKNGNDTQAGAYGKMWADPIGNKMQHVTAEGKEWSAAGSWRSTQLNAVTAADGRAIGRITQDYWNPTMLKPAAVSKEFVQPVPFIKQPPTAK